MRKHPGVSRSEVITKLQSHYFVGEASNSDLLLKVAEVLLTSSIPKKGHDVSSPEISLTSPAATVDNHEITTTATIDNDPQDQPIELSVTLDNQPQDQLEQHYKVVKVKLCFELKFCCSSSDHLIVTCNVSGTK